MLPGVRLVLFFDEPSLVCWRDAEGPVEREVAIDLLSSSLAATRAITGVHVCGSGDVRLALDAGPHVVHFDVGSDRPRRRGGNLAVPRRRWLVRVGRHPDAPAGRRARAAVCGRRLLETWCDLTRRGCDPARLRTQALIAPACGLAGHGESQAEHAMLLAREIGGRVHGHAAACKLAVGA